MFERLAFAATIENLDLLHWYLAFYIIVSSHNVTDDNNNNNKTKLTKTHF